MFLRRTELGFHCVWELGGSWPETRSHVFALPSESDVISCCAVSRHRGLRVCVFFTSVETVGIYGPT